MPKTPIVFVPGLGGSFNLLVQLDWRGPTLSGWDFPPFVDYGKTFLDAFTRAGYTRDVDLFVAFYDWRKSVGDSASSYLVPWINRAKTRSGSGKVILVAHSMGGLVSRAYIQGSGYRGDVERLITLGTPHRGSTDSYYPWEGGEIHWGPVVSAVFDVYLWYLEHIHPFQSGLDRLKTIRTQAPGTRDLLPLDDYLEAQGPPPSAKPVATMLERNLLGDIMLAPGGLNTLLGRVPLTTVTGVGFTTVRSLVVQAPPPPTDDPPRYVDGTPVSQQTTGDGDGTVLLSSAWVNDPRVHNRPSVAIAHDQLPDQAFGQVMAELKIPLPAAVVSAAPIPRLVIMTASPVELTIETPAAQPAVLGEAAPGRARRRGRVRAHNYGHAGKRLNIAVIPQPAPGTYDIRLRGTATGAFALGALMVGVQSTAVLGIREDAEPARQPLASPINTVQGQVAAATELHYQVEVTSYAAPPTVRFDAVATTRNALARLGAATAAPPPMVLGDAAPAPQVEGVLSASGASETLRDTVSAAIRQGDAAAIERLVALLRGADAETLRLLSSIAEQIVGPRDRDLALGLLAQLRQIAGA